MTVRLFLRLMTAFALVIFVATLTLYFLLGPAWQRSITQETEQNLRQKALMFAQRVEADRHGSLRDIAALQGQAAGARATIVDLNGNVLADSEAEPSSLGNTSDRAEFAAALHGQVGVATRNGNRVGVPVLFIAVPIQGGAVRLAYPLADVESSIRELHRQLGLGAVVALLFSLPIALLGARWITRRGEPLPRPSISTESSNAATTLATFPSDSEISLSLATSPAARPALAEDAFSEVQRNQQQLETLLNSMQDAVIAVDAEGRVQWANQGMQELTQRVRLQSPLVETVRDPEFLRAMKEAAETRTVRGARAISIVSGKTFDVTAAPLPDGGAVAVLRDLTERELLEKTRRDFIGNVSHELRTPLTSIQGYSETLLDSMPQESSQREFLEIIRKNAARMSRLTEDLLALARVESGEKRFDLDPVKPEELLRDAAQNFAETASGRDLQLEVKDDAPQLVLADRDAIHHVFGNLLENAVKYGGSGTRVVLGARPLEGSVEFYVQDFGQGIPSEHLARLFERFYRVDKARSRESGGTGLGLSIAKHIVLAHGGTIRAESELNHGATFLFTLPVASDENVL